MTSEKKQEFTRRISQANPTDMVVIIYDIALEYIDEAEAAIETASRLYSRNEGRTALREAVINIRKCINELIGSLNYAYSPAGEMLKLYVYCSRLLVKVDTKEDREALAHIKSILTRLRDAYAKIAPANKAGAVMQNSQSVYAGLTYGRNTLTEDVVGSGNRGFLA